MGLWKHSMQIIVPFALALIPSTLRLR